MKVLVTGSTGVAGRAIVPALVREGHDVTAVVCSEGKADQVRRWGAAPVQVDLFDTAALRRAVIGYEAVCNFATHIPSPHGPRGPARGDRTTGCGGRSRPTCPRRHLTATACSSCRNQSASSTRTWAMRGSMSRYHPRRLPLSPAPSMQKPMFRVSPRRDCRLSPSPFPTSRFMPRPGWLDERVAGPTVTRWMGRLEHDGSIFPLPTRLGRGIRRAKLKGGRVACT